MYMLISAAIIVLGVATTWGAIAAIGQFEKSKAPKTMTWGDVHNGLPVVKPLDLRQFAILDDIYGGEPTQVIPMVFELREETPVLPARDRFTGPLGIVGAISKGRRITTVTTTLGDGTVLTGKCGVAAR